ncbi:sulfotransferase family protein [Pseudomonas sp. N040]|uniref:sulfotransferase family protein n=1 Tax=Pseudomonas sp. N040 TaxID=2785325 RepID=UPI0018A2C399|nr:hypothetical protein [Pseudomonas sp. N040]MBF7731742.1 hypothetical protein [Pseudomonas sp. N040]MBW7015386.1 hypothetical protein [Pseudomonas sp. N040]
MTATAISSPSARAVLVLGMHRSGTSVLANGLATLGVELGERLMPPSPDNPKGYFENIEVVAFNERLLSTCQSRWDSILAPTMPEHVQETHAMLAEKLLDDQFGRAKLWGIKDPRMTRLLPFWRMVLDNRNTGVYYLLANRHPASVCASLAKRDNLPPALALTLWLQHQSQGLQALLEHGGLVVDYDCVLNAPLEELQRIGEFLHLPTEKFGALQLKAFSDDFLDPELRRNSDHSFPAEQFHNSRLPELSLQLHNCLSLWARTNGTPSQQLLEQSADVLRQLELFMQEQYDWLACIDQTRMDCARQLLHSAMELKSAKKKRNQRVSTKLLRLFRLDKLCSTRQR